MDSVWKRASVIFEKKPEACEYRLIKDELKSLLQELSRIEIIDHRTFQILNTFAIDYKPWIVKDLEILKLFVSIITSLLQKDKKTMPEMGRKWALRVLRWLLVIDFEVSDVTEVKKCFLMAVPIKEFYSKQLEIGFNELIEKIFTYISVRDLKLLNLCLDGLAEYFKIDPNLNILSEQIIKGIESVLDQLMVSNDLLQIVPDNFVANLVLESDSFYYKSLQIVYKKELCKCFIDVFEFQILQIENEEWFISFISKDLNEFKKFSKFHSENTRNNNNNNLKTFLEKFKDKIINFGRLKGFHSLLAYEKCMNE